MQFKEVKLPIFYPGRKIQTNNKIYTVEHVRIIKYKLLVKFKELQDEIDSEKIDCEPMIFVLK